MRKLIVALLVPLFILMGNITISFDVPNIHAGSNLQNAGMPYEKVDMQSRFDYAGGSSIVYIGYAKPGITINDTGWQIMKVLYSGANVIAIVYADSSNDYDKVWSLRAGYTYLTE